MKSYTVTVACGESRAIINVNVAGPTPMITEVHLTAPVGHGLTATEVLDLLLRGMPDPGYALVRATEVAAAVPPPAPAPALPATALPKSGETGAGAPAQRRTMSRKGEARERSYRTMPADFVDRYERSATIGALAESYGVPRHTAQAWINTARRHGRIKPAKQYASRG
jgi:hypothetical protein